jgi:hypothetical protein
VLIGTPGCIKQRVIVVTLHDQQGGAETSRSEII